MDPNFWGAETYTILEGPFKIMNIIKYEIEHLLRMKINHNKLQVYKS